MRKRLFLYKTAKALVATLVLAACLFGDSVVFQSNALVGAIRAKTLFIFYDSGMQWVIFLCLGIYFTVFLSLRSRLAPVFWRLANPSPWLVCTLLISAVLYAIDYSPSTQALTLLGCAVLGQGLVAWADFEIRNRLEVLIVTTLIVLLLAASLWLPEWSPSFALRGYARWTGPWDNPNTYGLLMGVGVALAFGAGISVLGSGDSKCKTWKYVCALLSFFAAILIGRGLLHSYSRGAWLATFCGTAYLFWNLRRGNSHLTPALGRLWRPRGATTRGVNLSPRPPGGERESLSCTSCGSWFNKNWLPLSAILLSVVVLSFWHFRQTEWYPARRVFSVTNTLDSTWRNRVAAWECAFQITAEHPCFGAGWNQPGRLYEHYYFSPEVPERASIRLNDYLLLGATLGIPALFCFGMYIWLSLTMKTGDRSQPVLRPDKIGTTEGGKSEAATLDFRLGALDSLQATCRAAVIVLLVGFWFDGGLFRLPTAATFWILLELGRADLVQQKITKETKMHPIAA